MEYDVVYIEVHPAIVVAVFAAIAAIVGIVIWRIRRR
jgi:hypothetical protein